MFKARLRQLFNRCPNCGSGKKYRTAIGFCCEKCGCRWNDTN